MNFKPTLWKSIVSVLFLIFGQTLFVTLAFRRFVFVNPLNGLDFMGSFGIIVMILLSILIYILWSFFQKKKGRK